MEESPEERLLREMGIERKPLTEERWASMLADMAEGRAKMKRATERLIGKLTPRERRVLKLRFGWKEKHPRIAEIEAKAIAKLRGDEADPQDS